jgi:HK97 family phage portal protein
MKFSTTHLKRYREIAGLFWKYGRSDLVKQMGVDEDDAKAVVAGLKSKMGGASNAGDLAFVNASLKISPWSMTGEDAQFLESRVHQVEEVARILGIPPHLLGQTEKQTSWGTGVSEQNRGLTRYTLRNYSTPFEQRCSRLLSNPRFVEFEYKGLLQAAPEQEIPLLISQVEAGLLSMDEARAILNLPPLAVEDTPAPPAEEGPENDGT